MAGATSFDGNIGPVGNVASGKLFDDTVALDARYQFNGSKENGAQWRERTRGYLISKSPALYKLLAWAEAQDQQQIEVGHIMAAAGNSAPQGDIELLNIALWGFLATCTNGTAETVFNSGAKLNGLEGWRRLPTHRLGCRNLPRRLSNGCAPCDSQTNATTRRRRCERSGV